MSHHESLLTACLILGLSSVNAQASLTVADNGLSVYDSGINASWTQDGNLLGSLESSQGFNAIVNTIIANDPIIYDLNNSYDNNGTGQYQLSISDFGYNGRVDWWAAQAFVSYLNSLNNGSGYGGSNHWVLPSTPDIDTSIGSNINNSQLSELYYNELNALAYPGTNSNDYGILHQGSTVISGNAGPFSNAQADRYWFGTEFASDPTFAWFFNNYYGSQVYTNKDSQFFVWAVSPAQGNPVPVPGAVWLFGTGILGLLGLKRGR